VSRPDVLHAIAARDGAALREVLAAGGDPNQRGAGGEPALSHAVWSGDSDLVAALLDAGAAADGASDCGNTALMHAVARGYLDIAKLLQSRGASLSRRNKWGLGAEDWAQWPVNGADITAELGLGRG
jgi:ankyrin repeat protein